MKPPPGAGSTAIVLDSIPSGQSSVVFCQKLLKLMEGNPEPPGCKTWECTSTAGSLGAVDGGRTEQSQGQAAFPLSLSSHRGTEIASCPALHQSSRNLQ